MTPRQAFSAIAVVLILILLALIVYLLFFMNNGAGLVTRGGATKSGIRPLFTIDGPGKGMYHGRRVRTRRAYLRL
jgi:hypothetical protein